MKLNSRAFSLVEVLAAVAIIGIILTTILGTLLGVARGALRARMRQATRFRRPPPEPRDNI